MEDGNQKLLAVNSQEEISNHSQPEIPQVITERLEGQNVILRNSFEVSPTITINHLV